MIEAYLIGASSQTKWPASTITRRMGSRSLELGVDEQDYWVVAAAFRPSFAPPNLPGQVPRHCRPGLTSERHGRDRKPRRDISATRRLGLKSTFPGRFGPPKALACPSGESYDRFDTA